MTSRTTGQSVLDKVSIQRQIEAALLQLDAALINGNAADVRHLRQHIHILTDKVMNLQAELIDILKASVS